MADDINKINLSRRFNMGLAVLEEYSWFLDSYILDFFVEQHYKKLPKSWRDYFERISITELGKFLDFEKHKCGGVWTLSLLCLQSIMKFICLSRRPDTVPLLPATVDEELANLCRPEDKYLNDEMNSFYKRFCIFKHPKLEALFSRHVKPKKRYEIWKMAEATAETAEMLNVSHVIDIGSGLGHLSRISAYAFGLTVLSIESQADLSEEAKKIDKELEVTASKYLPKSEMETILKKRPIHVNMTITEDVTPTEFIQLIKKSFKEGENVDQFGIVGLHPCGDLALKLLDLFLQCKEAKFINIVGCCYHKVTVSSENGEDKSGFPLSSSYGKNVPVLRFEARSLACHALETYSQRLLANNYDHLKIHCYRATLEYIISKNWPNLRRSPMCNVKHGKNLTFKLYCEKALKKLELSVSEEDIESEETLRYLSEWKNVVIYYSLRLMFAPLIESVILIDRMLYLIENERINLMGDKITGLKANQQILGDKIKMLNETRKKKDEEAEKIRELIAECRENLNRIKSEAMTTSQRTPKSQFKSPCLLDQERNGPSFRKRSHSCDKSDEDPCKKYLQPCVEDTRSPCRGSQEDPCAKYLSPEYSSKRSSANEESSFSADTCDSATARIESQLQALSEAKEKSRKCIDKLGEKMEKEVKMKITSINNIPCPPPNFTSKLFDTSECEQKSDISSQDRLSCRVDLNKLKVNINGPPEDLKKLDAVQLINLLDKFQCQELIITTGSREHAGNHGEVPVFYISHPGNIALIFGVIMVAFLLNTNLCSPKRGCKTRFALNMLYLGSFSFHYGIVLWMSFIRGLTLSAGLPRDVFNTVDNLILPKYFSICVFLSAISLYSFLATQCTAPCTSWPLSVKVQVLIESSTFLTELVAICYIVPAILKLRETISEFTNEDDECSLPESFSKNAEKLTKLNWTITFINTLTAMFMGSSMYYVSSKLNIG